MQPSIRVVALLAMLAAFALVEGARAADIHVKYADPNPPGSMPEFGSVPFPTNLYFDGGAPGAGDGTLINQDPNNPDGFERFGLEVSLLLSQDRALIAGLDRLDGFGVTTPVWFFFDGPIQESSLPGEPVINNGLVQRIPGADDSVFLVELGSAPPRFIPVKFRFGFETRVPNLLAMVPLEGEVLGANTEYVGVVTRSLKSDGAGAVQATLEFDAAKGSPNHSAAMAYLTGTLGIKASDIVGLAPFRTQTTTATLRDIRSGIVDDCPITVDFSDGLVFADPNAVERYFGAGVAPNVALAASGFYASPRLQGLDPTDHSHRDGSGGAAENDLPLGSLSEIDDEQFEDRGSNGTGCELTTGATPDGLPDVVDLEPNTPGVLDLAMVPVSLAVPNSLTPAAGWPVIIVQHGLGGSRTTTMGFAEGAAQQGFAVIGIDSVDHGLRWDETDDEFNFTNEPGQDGLPDGDLGGAVNLGFFEAFSSVAAIRDNFRQTYVDLMQLVHILAADGFDAAVGVDLDPDNIYYLGLSLGGLMGAGMTPYVPEVRGIVLDAPGGGLTTELFANSSIGAGSIGLIQAIFGLDAENPSGDFALFSGLSQSLLDAGDGTVSAVHWVEGAFPPPFQPMNVILIESMNDQVVPNQSNESLAVAAGLELFDPHVENLPGTTRPLPVASTQGFLEHNVAGNVTAGVFQVGPDSHAQISEGVSTLTFVPGFAHVDEFRNGDTDTAFVPLIRNVRIKHPEVLADIYDWFRDMVSRPGEGGRFQYTGAQLAFNSYENQTVEKGSGTYSFFVRNVNAAGAVPYEDPIPNASIGISANKTVGRITMVRSTLGATLDGDDRDMPPLVSLGTPNVLPFFLGVQRPQAPAYRGRALTLEYTDDELDASGCAADALFLARHNPITDAYDALPSTPDPPSNTVRLADKHYQGGDGVYGAFCSTEAAPFNQHLTGKTVKLKFPKNPGGSSLLKLVAEIRDPSNTLEIDPTLGDIVVRVWEDRETELYLGTMDASCWTPASASRWTWNPSCAAAGDFTKASLKKIENSKGTTFKLSIQASGAYDIDTSHEGGGGLQLQVVIDGVSRNTSGGKCAASAKKIACSRYD